MEYIRSHSLSGNNQTNTSMNTMKIENDQLKKDNAYLVGLIKESKQFKNLADHIDDSGGSISVLDFTPTKKKMSRTDSQNSPGRLSRTGLIPRQMFKIGTNFGQQHGNDLSQDLI